MKIAELKRISEAASVRGTEKQDTAIAASRQPWHKQRWVHIAGASTVVVVALVAWLLHAWSNSAHVIAAERLRIVNVTKGRFVRDVAAQGTVIAAVNPTLFAVASGTISYVVRAGDTVTKGQVLATLDSPELNNEYQREHARTGRFEAADGGTLFLDELGNLSASGQAKLLRVLQTGEFSRLGSNHRAQGVVAQAARELGLSRQALYRRMDKLGLRSGSP